MTVVCTSSLYPGSETKMIARGVPVILEGMGKGGLARLGAWIALD